MNLQTFRLRVQRTLGLAATTDSHDEQTLVDGWVNEAREQFLIRTKIVKKTASLALTADEGDYTIDANILAFEDAYIVPAEGQERMLDRVDSGEIRRLRRTASQIATHPYLYSYEAQTIMVYPTPGSSDDTLHIVYVPRPTSALSATGHDPADAGYGDIPSEYHPALEAYTKWKAAEYVGHEASKNGQTYKEEWLSWVAEAKVIENRKGGVQRLRAQVGRRGRSGMPIGNGVDLGY